IISSRITTRGVIVCSTTSACSPLRTEMAEVPQAPNSAARISHTSGLSSTIRTAGLTPAAGIPAIVQTPPALSTSKAASQAAFPALGWAEELIVKSLNPVPNAFPAAELFLLDQTVQTRDLRGQLLNRLD